jgi:hypothetical protein
MSGYKNFSEELEIEFKPVIKESITNIFSQKLDILRLIKNNFTQNEYQKCMNALINEFENILSQKLENEIKEALQKISNINNYFYDQEEYIFQINITELKIEGKFKFINDFLSNLNNVKNFIENYDKTGPHKISSLELNCSNIHEIFFIYSLISSNKITEIHVKIDVLDKYLIYLFRAFKKFNSDNCIFISFYSCNGNIYAILDVYISEKELFSEEENKSEYEKYKNNKLIRNYQINNLKKLILDGYGLYKVFSSKTLKSLYFCLSIDHDNNSKYINYNNIIWKLHYSKKYKELFES